MDLWGVKPPALQGGHEADWVDPDAAKELECPICMKARFFVKCQEILCLSDLFESIHSDGEPVSRLALP